MKKNLVTLLLFSLFLTACGENTNSKNTIDNKSIEADTSLAQTESDDIELESITIEEQPTDEKEEILLGEGTDNPVKIGESVNFKYIDYMHTDSENSTPIVDCIITYNSYEDGIIHLNFEVLSYIENKKVVVNDSLNSIVYDIVDKNMSTTFIDYEKIYKEDDGTNYFSVYESGNLDFCIDAENGNYLTITYVPPTEENLNKNKGEYYSEDVIWFTLQ